jgi:quinoprotein glucose dehydrogenase
VGQLELAWSYQTGAIARHPDRKAFASFHATPLLLPKAAGQSLVFCTPFNRIIALDPVTGDERWAFDPARDLGPPGRRFNCRGIAYWHDKTRPSRPSCEHRLFMGTFDLQLFAIDARTGQVCEDFGDRGNVDVQKLVNKEVEAKARAIGRPANYRPGDLQFSSPPAIIGDTVVVGSSNNTKFRRIDGPSGVVRAFNARTGKIIWTFDPVPRNPGDPEAENWTAEALRTTGAANVWSMMSVDEERDLLFLPTASASPDFFGGTRPGDNRYANSVVALHGSTGEIAWHYQIVHHDVWDLDLPAQPILVDILVDGQQVPVVIQLTKQGMIFVLHRETGEPVFPVEERPVPQDGVPGEILAPTQPYPTHLPLLVPQGITADDAWGFTFFDRGFCRDWIERTRHDHYYAPPSLEGTSMFPGMSVNNWGGGAFSSDRNVLIVPINQALIMRRLIPVAEVDPEVLENPMAGLMGLPGEIDGTAYAQQFKPMLSPLFSPCNPPPWGELAAIDLEEGKILWRRNLGVLDKLMPVPIPLPWGTPNSGGPIVTDGGLIFIGATMDERFRAFDIDSGEQLWETGTPTASMATPMTYQIDGKQFVVIASGGHMWQYSFKIADYLVAYALP